MAELELKGEILLEKGEDEMVLEMGENGNEFRERVEKGRFRKRDETEPGVLPSPLI